MYNSQTESSFVMKILSGLTALFGLCVLIGALNKTGRLILLWDAAPLHQVEPNQGKSFVAPLGRAELARLGVPVFLSVGRAVIPNPILSVNEDLIAAIAAQGGGRYTLDPSGSLVFSLPDGSEGGTGFDDVRVLIPNTSFRLIYLIALAMGFGAALGLNLYSYRRSGIGIAAGLRKEASFVVSVNAAALICFTILPNGNALRTMTPVRLLGDVHVLPYLKRDEAVLALTVFAAGWAWARLRRWTALRAAAVLALAAGIVYVLLPTFAYLGFRVDSAEYLQPYSAASLRTPGYPIFIEGTIGESGRAGLAYWRSNEGIAAANAMGERLFHASEVRYGTLLIRPIHAQKLLLIAMFLLVWIVLWKGGDFWLAYGFAAVALGADFLGVYNDYFMSEVLAQALMMLAAAVFMTLMLRRRAELMPALGIAAGLTFLVRPAGLVTGLLMLIPSWTLICVWRAERKKALLGMGLGWGVFLALSSIPGAVIFRDSGRFIWTPNAHYVSVANAVQLMDETDVINEKDEEARSFLEACLKLRDELEKSGVPLTQNAAMWDVAVAAAKSMGYGRIQANVLFGKVANRVNLNHADAYRDLILERIREGLTRSRIHFGRLSALMLGGVFVMMGLLCRSRFSIAGLTLIALHWIHFLLSMQNQPERRYIWSTEIFFVLGAALVVFGALSGFIQPDKRNGSRG